MLTMSGSSIEKSTVCEDCIETPNDQFQSVDNTYNSETWSFPWKGQEVISESCLTSLRALTQHVQINLRCTKDSLVERDVETVGPQQVISRKENLRVPAAVDWVLVFDSYPVWIFSLTPRVVNSILVLQVKNGTIFVLKLFHIQDMVQYLSMTR